MMEENKILFIGPIASRSGYGAHAREIAEYLCKYDSDFVVTKWGDNPMNALSDDSDITKEILKRIKPNVGHESYDICIYLGLPNEFKTIGKYNIGITAAVEADQCPHQFIVGCNSVDLVITPSEFTKETILNTEFIKDASRIKCTTPIEVIGETVSESFHFKNNSESDTLNSHMKGIQEDFCYLFVGQWVSSPTDNGGRKNITSLIKTFASTFQNESHPPALLLKTNGTDFSLHDEVDMTNRIKQAVADLESPPSIYLLHGDLTDDEIASMYNHPKVKCHISHTHGEGFGRPLLEASLSGKPVIAPKWSGHLDFLPKKNKLLIPGKLKPVGAVNGLFPKDSNWFEVDTDKSRELMLDVFTNYERHEKRAKALADDNTKKFGKTNIFNIYNNILSQYIPKKKKYVELKLPTIQKLPT